MCGRYYFDEETLERIRKDLKSLQTEFAVDEDIFQFIKGDVFPNQTGAVIMENEANQFTETFYVNKENHINLKKDLKLQMKSFLWGFPGFAANAKSVVFNARSETAMEKRMFKDSLRKRRCIIPVASFYEWDKDKNKFTFMNIEGQVLYLAGFYNLYGTDRRFVILTTDANDSVKAVHARMPLILKKEQICDWIFDEEKAVDLMTQTPMPLKSKGDSSQISMNLNI